MITTTYGYKKPQTGDTGATIFPAMEDNITRLDAHSHDGTNSARLTAASSLALNADILAAAWVATTGGRYRQVVTLPAALTDIDKVNVAMQVSTGERVYPAIEKITATTYYVYTLDNTLQYKAIYTT